MTVGGREISESIASSGRASVVAISQFDGMNISGSRVTKTADKVRVGPKKDDGTRLVTINANKIALGDQGRITIKNKNGPLTREIVVQAIGDEVEINFGVEQAPGK